MSKTHRRPSIRRTITMTLAAAVVTSLAAVVPSAPSSAAPGPAALAPVPAAARTAPVAGAVTTGPLFTRLAGKVDLPATLDGLVRRVDPAEFLALHIDQDAIAGRMATSASRETGAVLSLPSPEGGMQRFRIEPTRTMEDGLAAAHPEIKTYAGRSIDGTPSTVRLDTTISGFHAMVVDGVDSWFVEPAYQDAELDADALYLSYRLSQLTAPAGFDESAMSSPEVRAQFAVAQARARKEQAAQARRTGEASGAPVIMREYRLAMTTDSTYASKVVPATIPINDANMAMVNQIVTGAKVSLTNRVNEIYNADVAFNLVLVNDNDKLNLNTPALFSGTNGPCGAAACFAASSDCSDVLDTNEPVVGQVIGADNFDIGHLSMGEGFGGVAYLGVVGEDMKAGGCTSLTAPFGDGFAIDFVAHEMGHQFSGNHTFDGVSGSCMATNRNAGTSVEPGSGTSVMAYAGICFSDDTQPHTDPYFSQRTQDEFTARATAAKTSYSEQQKFVLRNFDGTDSFRLVYPGSGTGSGTTAVIANGSNYTVAGIDAAITAVAGGNPTVSAVTVNGFTVTWAGTADYRTPTVNVVNGVFSGFGNAIVNGGPGTNGGWKTSTGPNRAPVVVAPPTRTIPIQTPFELTGSGTDADGDPLTYLWEQNDIGAQTGSLLITAQRQFGPLFRVLGKYAPVTVEQSQQYHSPNENLATTSPTRTFPDIEQIIAGSTNAETGACPLPPSSYTDPTSALPNSPALDCYSELLPMPGYLGDGPYVPTPLDSGFPDVVPPQNPLGMRFRLTGRDLGGADGGVDGGYGFSEVVLDIDPTAGPFLVSSQGTATTVAGNTAGTITWDTARTDLLGLADNVKISLSTDGGRTYPTTLLATTPNDGSQAITWPNIATTTARVKVSAIDNYFFDINNANITINAVPGLTLAGNTPGSFTVQHSDALAPKPFIDATSATVNGSAITATASGLPAGLSLTQVSSSAAGVRPGTAHFEVTGTTTADAGSYPVTVSVTDGAATAQTTTFTVVVTKEDATVSYTGPSQATASQGGTNATQVTVSADVAEAADGALGGLTATTATFTDATTGETLCTAPVTVTNGAGAASCAFGANLTGTDDRTYQVVVTLGGQHYSGATAQPSPLVVRYDTGLVVDGPATASAAQYSDALDPALSLTISDRFVESPAFTVTSTGLPAGLSLGSTAASGAGVLPGTATYAVSGTVTDAPGSYPVTVTIGDGGAHPAITKQVTITVTRENATASYTGPTQVVTKNRGTGVAPVTLTADLTPAADGTPGDIATATATFTDQAGTTLCTSTVTAAGKASCSASLNAPASGDGSTDVTVTVGGRYLGATASPTTINVLVDDGLALSAPTSTSPSGQYSDAVTPASSVTASARFVAADSFTATASGLPAGLALTRSGATAAGVTPGQATYTVTGTTTAAPGSYPVTITLADGGAHTAVTRTLTVTVTREDASVSYTGPTTVPAAATDTSKQFTMTARVTDLGTTGGTDSTVGDVTTATVTFRDTATNTVLCTDAPVTLTSAGVGTAACSVTAQLPADGDRTYRVALVLGGRYVGTSTADAPVVVDQAEAPVGDTTPPQTTITSGPGQGNLVLPRDIRFGYASSETPGTFTCSLSGIVGACPATSPAAGSGALTIHSLRPGSYDFRIAATDAAGNTDPTPVVRRFYVPVNDRKMTAVRGPWKRKTSATSYRGDYTHVAQKDAELTYQVTNATSLALVATKGPAYGVVTVYLGNRKLRSIQLKAAREATQVISGFATFSTPTSGLVRIVTHNARPVRIDGLGVRTSNATSPRAAQVERNDRMGL